MTNSKYCSQCGLQLQSNTKFCNQCGSNTSSSTEIRSDKSAVITLLLCIFLGSLGLHRFYVGKVKTGILMLLTGGGLGIWTLVDLIQIACCNFTDKENKYLIFTRGRASPLKLILIIVCSVIGVLFVYIILLMSLLFYFTGPMTTTIREQLTALQANDVDKAYSYMANETKADVSLDTFKKYISHYPQMTNYKSISIPERQINNDKGYAKVTLETNDGKKTTFEYNLTKENGVWKILVIHAPEIKSDTQQTNPSANAKLFEDRTNHYTIQYPEDWHYKQTGEHAVLFEGKKGTRSYYSSIIIQVVHANAANEYKNVTAAMDELKKQISKQRTNVQISNSGPIELPTDPKNIRGESCIITFKLKGHEMKQMLFLLSRDGGKTLYSWAYISPIKQYNNDLSIAKAMFESWKIE
jgi:TM2 domain-containing membrane protein YozV